MVKTSKTLMLKKILKIPVGAIAHIGPMLSPPLLDYNINLKKFQSN